MGFSGKLRKIMFLVVILIWIAISIAIIRTTDNYETSYYIMQIILSGIMTCGVLIAACQYYVTSKANRIEKAIEMAEYYKDSVLSLFSVIAFVFTQSGIMDVLLAVDKKDMKYFDIEESRDLFGEERTKKIEELMHSEKLIDSIIMADNLFHIGLAKEEVVNENEKRVRYNMDEVYRTFWSNYMEKTMNNLEYFSMYFMHNISDESVVFPSLNQTFIDIIETLYYHIAKTNKLKEPKYYTNVIALYIKWKARNEESKERNLNAQRQIRTNSSVL